MPLKENTHSGGDWNDWLSLPKAADSTHTTTESVTVTTTEQTKKGEGNVDADRNLLLRSNWLLFCSFTSIGITARQEASAKDNTNKKRKPKGSIHPNAAKQSAAAAATELARSQYFLKQTEANDLESEKDGDGSSSSTDSDAEDRYTFSDGPADRAAEQGTWWYRLNR